jgi:hypothetical protein
LGEGASFWAFLVVGFSQCFAFSKEGLQIFLQSSLFVLILPCLGKIIFFLFLVKTCSMFWRDVYFYVDFKIALDFPLLLQYYGGSFSLNIVLLLVGSSFFVAFVGGVLCVYLYVYYTRLWFCLFWACWVSGSFSGGPGHIFFLRGAPLCGVSVRYYLFEC